MVGHGRLPQIAMLFNHTWLVVLQVIGHPFAKDIYESFQHQLSLSPLLCAGIAVDINQPVKSHFSTSDALRSWVKRFNSICFSTFTIVGWIASGRADLCQIAPHFFLLRCPFRHPPVMPWWISVYRCAS